MQPVDVSWLVRLRRAAAVLFLLLALAAGSVFHIPVPPLAVAAVWAVQVGSNVALSLRRRRHRTVRATTVAGLMALDTLLLTVLLAFSGGPSNPFSVLYLVDVALGAVVLTPGLTWALLGLVLLCFGALFLPAPWSPGATLDHAELIRLHLRGMWVAFALAGGMLVAFVLRVRRALAEREAELASERERAVRRDRLASLATLAAGTAHALGSPLSTIAVAAHELERRLQSLPEAAEDARSRKCSRMAWAVAERRTTATTRRVPPQRGQVRTSGHAQPFGRRHAARGRNELGARPHADAGSSRRSASTASGVASSPPRRGDVHLHAAVSAHARQRVSKNFAIAAPTRSCSQAGAKWPQSPWSSTRSAFASFANSTAGPGVTIRS